MPTIDKAKAASEMLPPPLAYAREGKKIEMDRWSWARSLPSLPLSASFCVICVLCLQFYQGTAFHAHFCLQFRGSSDFQWSHAFLDHLESHKIKRLVIIRCVYCVICDNDEANTPSRACGCCCCCRHNHCSRCNTTFYSSKWCPRHRYNRLFTGWHFIPAESEKILFFFSHLFVIRFFFFTTHCPSN